MKTVSGTFEARTDAGTCPLCRQGFSRGEVCAFLKAHATGSSPDRKLNRREVAEFKRAFASLQREARRQGILPRTTRTGRVARRQRPAGFDEVPGVTAPEWLWDHMVHVRCLPAWTGSRVQDAQITARPNGRRTAGAGHGAALGETPAVETTETPAEPEVSGAVSEANENARVMQGEIERIRNRRTPSWVESFSRAPDAIASREAAQAANKAQRERLAREAAEHAARDPGAHFEDGARIPDLSDDPEPVTVPEDDGEDDPSIQRFRLLDLD